MSKPPALKACRHCKFLEKIQKFKLPELAEMSKLPALKACRQRSARCRAMSSLPTHTHTHTHTYTHTNTHTHTQTHTDTHTHTTAHTTTHAQKHTHTHTHTNAHTHTAFPPLSLPPLVAFASRSISTCFTPLVGLCPRNQ